MLKKLKKTMVVAAAAVTLSTGFATVAPQEAQAAHWADLDMRWAFKNGIVTADLRDNLATRQDAWLMIYRDRKQASPGDGYAQARAYVIKRHFSDGSRGTDWITRNEMIGMLYQGLGNGPAWNSKYGFSRARQWGIDNGFYDGSRGNDFATRAEIIAMLHRLDGNR
ncbi:MULTISPECIES: hypothetical protein [Bacillus cereus group]|uniref:hypothetical protein n=1 Tax=Bacillus cereus group TaxID=86661 RepID=UPI000279C331|nr:hypothetical protein [Bacillus cereus]EJR83986.1 hypothetical protein IK7_01708 [Bacillus cereus VD156]